MARATHLEELQCLAFAFFAKNTYRPSEDHLQKWVDVFTIMVAAKDFELEDEEGKKMKVRKGTRITQEVVDDINASPTSFDFSNLEENESNYVATLKSIYGEFLSDGFNFQRPINKYSTTITQQDNGRLTNSVHEKVKMSYGVAEAFVKTPLIPYDLSSYAFLDQNDEFTNTVKNESLEKIKRVLGLKGSSELLSPVDMFFVRKRDKDAILREFKEHIIDASDEQILANMSFGATGKNTYRTITRKHFADRSMLGVSLKFPKTIGSTKSVKIVGTVLEHTTGSKELLPFVDPYGKLVSQMMVKNADIAKLIDKAITIKFDKFNIDSNRVSWEYPIDFNYDDMVDAKTREPLYHSKLQFELLTWTDAGFNGWWRLGGSSKSPWVSGVAVGSAQQLFYRYQEYAGIMKDIIDIRTRVFKEMVPKAPKEHKAAYDAALRELGGKALLRATAIPLTKTFFSVYNQGDPEPDFSDYMLEVIRRLTEGMKSNIVKSEKQFTKGQGKAKKIIPALHAHFVAAQLAFFLFHGGKDHELLLKKRIFLSLFGLLTKSGYKIFEGNAGKLEMTNYVRKLFQKNEKTVEAYYNAAPFVLLT